jgi:hypothetical protein
MCPCADASNKKRKDWPIVHFAVAIYYQFANQKLPFDESVRPLGTIQGYKVVPSGKL